MLSLTTYAAPDEAVAFMFSRLASRTKCVDPSRPTSKYTLLCMKPVMTSGSPVQGLKRKSVYGVCVSTVLTMAADAAPGNPSAADTSSDRAQPSRRCISPSLRSERLSCPRRDLGSNAAWDAPPPKCTAAPTSLARTGVRSEHLGTSPMPSRADRGGVEADLWCLTRPEKNRARRKPSSGHTRGLPVMGPGRSSPGHDRARGE